MEVLSEHNCHGWLEGNTLTGRHGMFATYEAFAIDAAGSPPGSTDTLVPAATGSPLVGYRRASVLLRNDRDWTGGSI